MTRMECVAMDYQGNQDMVQQFRTKLDQLFSVAENKLKRTRVNEKDVKNIKDLGHANQTEMTTKDYAAYQVQQIQYRQWLRKQKGKKEIATAGTADN